MTDATPLPSCIQDAIVGLPEPPRRVLEPITAEDLLRLDIPPRKLLLSPWLPEKGLAMIVGPRGVGKTYLAVSIALAVASGGSVLGWEATAAKRVLYVDGEMPTATVQQRLAAMVKGSAFDQANGNLSFLLADRAGSLPDLSTRAGHDEIADYLDPFDLIVFDNMSTLLHTGHENEAESWGPMQEFLLRLRRTGKSCLLIHHTGKGGSQRGTSRREDVLDTVLLLKRPEDQSSAEGARFIGEFSKARGFFGPDAECFEALLDPETLQWQRMEKTRTLKDDILALKDTGLSQREIAGKLSTNATKVNRVMKGAGHGGS
jgi:RecA-family ATPase